jgi:hypothetical protein
MQCLQAKVQANKNVRWRNLDKSAACFCHEKAACKILVKLTVIPKFFAQLLSAYNLGFLFFLQKDFGAKKLLIKCW